RPHALTPSRPRALTTCPAAHRHFTHPRTHAPTHLRTAHLLRSQTGTRSTGTRS
ncbi:hypothetical protein K431DRAFT_289900, partial [Polychaeton citri CBS 116435]